ncbi:hypothetical protein QYM36_007459 [Artemia franciscana]|uniref:ADP-ribosylation factor-like protein 5B n=1 Tax=Artemia franciscana TaxID=6661 RepID=A0AA88LLL0_ARTSF|nr:hypothetical protein QYM36_007459 [Artemia franciscana]
MVCQLKAYYKHCRLIIRVLGKETEPFSVESSVKQGCILSHVLFNYFIDWILERALSSSDGVVMGLGINVSNLDYADDINALAADPATAQAMLNEIVHFSQLLEHKIVIVGLDNAGKTTILYQFLMNDVVQTSPTIGSNVEEIVWKNIHFIMWDLGGQESLRVAWNTYYIHTEFIILVVDSTDRERLSISREELHKVVNQDELKNAAILLFANKQDVKGCMSVAEISRQLNLTSIKTHRWQIQPCCALTGEGPQRGVSETLKKSIEILNLPISNVITLVAFQCAEVKLIAV